MIGRSRWNGLNGDAACERRAADVTLEDLVTSSPFSDDVVPNVHTSASEYEPLRMKSRRDHASAGGRKLFISGSPSRSCADVGAVASRIAGFDLDGVAPTDELGARDVTDARAGAGGQPDGAHACSCPA